MDDDPSAPVDDTSSRTQTSSSSTRTGTSNSLAVDNRKKRSSRVPERFRQDREKALAGRSNRELIRLLIHEEYEAKDTRKLLHAAFDRLELETRRVAEADARVVEMAERCRNINDARLASQQDAARANEDLRIYKFQFDNAQQEIHRAQGVLKTIEGQRDDAAAAATRARDTARKYRENQLVYVAREEGRRLGYQEGLRHARYEQVGVKAIGYKDRASAYEDMPDNRFITDEPFNDIDSDEESITPEALSPASINLQGLPSATITEELEGKTPKTRTTPQVGALSPISVSLGSSRPVTWPVSQGNGDVPVVHNGQPSPHPEPPIPPEGWIPHEDENGVIAIPPAHEFERPPPSPSTAATDSTWVHGSSREPVVMYSQVAAQPSSASTTRHRRRESSPMSTASFASTSFSQFDITATGPELDPSPMGRDLSVIPEGSTQGELTPTVSGRRSRLETTMTTPALETDYGYSPLTDLTLTSPPVAETMQPIKANGYKGGAPRGRSPGQRLADELRYSDPDIVDTWRRSAADQLNASPDRPPRRRPANLTTPAPLSPISGLSPHINSSLQSSRNSRIPIDVQPPSTPGGYEADDRPHTPGLLSPYSLPISRPFVSDDESVRTEQPKMVPPPISRNAEASPSGYGRPYNQSPRTPSPERDPRDRRSKSTPREPASRSQTPYAMAPIPEGFNYPSPSPRPRTPYAPPISSSLSAGSTSSPRSSVSRMAHDHSLSMHAGATPAYMGRPLSGMSRDQSESTSRRPSSIASSVSTSARSSSYKAYNPNEYVDPAFLASSDDLTSMPSPAPVSRVASSSRNGRR